MLTILFDLDGTLLPMDQDVFVRDYFGHLAKKVAPFGYDPKDLPANLWKGVAAMVMNDGRCSNEEVFWNVFKKSMEKRLRKTSRFLTISMPMNFRKQQRSVEEIKGRSLCKSL